MGQARSAFELLKEEEMFIAVGILEESAYVGLSIIYGCRGFKLRDELKKGLNEESINFLEGLVSFLESMQIGVISPPGDPAMILDMIRNYKLLPADAAIAASCKYHEIAKIATFDSDFKRVDFLEVIGT
ncbi:MAG: PIN domain-containing protein [Methanothrix sp.]|uniref:PIN domain-containing protein n=1 Tax=Methanothrix sp. TaxID=90426 RepID=UPI003BB4E5D6